VILRVRDLSVWLGGSHILQGVTFDVAGSGVTALLGRNGVGKTTTLRALLGEVPALGAVELAGVQILGRPTHRLVQAGIGYVPEDRCVFAGLTVAENLRLAVRGPDPDYDTVHALFPELRDRAGQRAGTLSGGQQQMLAIARALMGRPKLLLLDEPSLGLSPKLVDEVLRQVPLIVRRGTSVLLAEQNVAKALKYCDRAYVIEVGRVAISGQADELRRSDIVRKAYLGG
jgi:branched-chain amino acid transport system ATP-binding protein